MLATGQAKHQQASISITMKQAMMNAIEAK
jgi:hypothetical protein